MYPYVAATGAATVTALTLNQVVAKVNTILFVTSNYPNIIYLLLYTESATSDRSVCTICCCGCSQCHQHPTDETERAQKWSAHL